MFAKLQFILWDVNDIAHFISLPIKTSLMDDAACLKKNRALTVEEPQCKKEQKK